MEIPGEPAEFTPPADGGPAHPGRVLKGMHRSERGKPVEGIVVLVPPMIDPRLQKLAAAEIHPVIRRQQDRFQVFRFVGIERRVEVRPAEELRLVAREQVRLRVGVAQLDATVDPVEVTVAKRHGTVRLRARPRHVGPHPAAARARGAGEALVELLAIQAVFARRQRQGAGRLDRPPAVQNGADGRIERAPGVVRPREDLRGGEHGGRNRNFGEVMPGLGVARRDRAQAEARVLKDAAADRDVGLGLGEIARLDVNLRLEPQRRDRHGK